MFKHRVHDPEIINLSLPNQMPSNLIMQTFSVNGGFNKISILNSRKYRFKIELEDIGYFAG